ncbi:MAG TPA: RNA polymerase sigma factor [Sphingomicrobium sp.]|nr:RNA polymerase sigma factor [Sphingomicrobium sp.]
MIDNSTLHDWFCSEVLPLEGVLMRFIHRNWRIGDDVLELRQDIYERALIGAKSELPTNTRAYLFTVARNHLINRAARSKIVSFEAFAELDSFMPTDVFATERHLDARDQLRRAQAGIAALPPRCGEVVRLRKIEGLSTAEAAERLGVSNATIERQLTMGMRALANFMLGGTAKLKRPSLIRRRRSAAG